MATSFHDVEGSKWTGAGLFSVTLISLPLDTVVDLVLFPVDMVAWLCGSKKREVAPP
jgi:hypothetical protein